MKTKPVTPYQRLKQEMNEFCDALQFRHRVPMHCYPNSKNDGSWNLVDLSYKVDAAEQLGYDVVLTNKPDGLHVTYVKKIPARPFVLTY
jgi:hypothetical protein